MDTNTQAQIFFIISSVGFVLLWIMVAIFLFFLIKTMSAFSRIIAKLEDNIEKISDATMDIFEEVQNNLIYRFFFGSKRKKHKASKEIE